MLKSFSVHIGNMKKLIISTIGIFLILATMAFAISADINIDPNTLNMRSKGKWGTAYIEIANKTGYAYINLSCDYWNQEGGHGMLVQKTLQEGESTSIGCGTVKLLQTNVDQADFEVDYLWKETFTLSEGEKKKIWWGEIIMNNTTYNVTTTVGLNAVIEQYGGNTMDVDVDTVELEYNGKIVKAENNRKYGFVKNPKPHDSDNDGIPEFMVKFDRQEVIKIVDPGMITLKVSGYLNDGSYFEGFDTIRVIGRFIPKFPKFILW